MSRKEKALKRARQWADENGLLRIYDCQKIFNLSWTGVRARTFLPDNDPCQLTAKTEGGKRTRVWITLDSIEKCISHWED